MRAQLESVAQRLERLEQARSAPGRERPEDAFHLARLSADAEREALNKLRVEVGCCVLWLCTEAGSGCMAAEALAI